MDVNTLSFKLNGERDDCVSVLIDIVKCSLLCVFAQFIVFRILWTRQRSKAVLQRAYNQIKKKIQPNGKFQNVRRVNFLN